MIEGNTIVKTKHCETTELPPANSCILVIFGVSGDLTKRLLFPSICNLGSSGLLNKNFYIIGVDKLELSTDVFHKQFKQDIDDFITDPAAKKFALKFLDRISYISGDFKNAEVYKKLSKQLTKLQQQKASPNVLFYFAVPPTLIEAIATGLYRKRQFNYSLP